jgi:hypothetical protein
VNTLRSASATDSSSPGSPSVTPAGTFLPGTESALPPPAPFTPQPTFNPSGQVPAEYNLDAVFNYSQHSLSVTERFRYTNRSTDHLAYLVLIVEPNLIPGGFTISSITWGDGSAIDSYALDGNLLQINMPEPLQPGEVMDAALNYQLQIPQFSDASSYFRPVAYGYSERQTNLVDWYAYIPPYRSGEGWLIHPLWGFGEYQVYDVSDFNVSIRLEEPVQGLAIAASAPVQLDGDRYKYHLHAARTFALSASTNYVVQTTEVGEVTIVSYSFPYDQDAGQEVLQNTADAVKLYSQLFLPYPRVMLSIVEADFLDGMEYDGLFFLSHGFYSLYDGTLKGYLTFIAAHETAHQWWYALVGNDQALEPWLDEALCTYMEHVFYENIDANAPPHSPGSLVDWWWYYRVNFYEPEGWVNATIYDYPDSRAYRDAVYLRGAKFLEDLRSLIGDQAFYSALQDYATTNQYSIATADDFFASLRRHTSLDIEDLLAHYFQSH